MKPPLYYEPEKDWLTSVFKGFGVGLLIVTGTCSGLLITASKVDGKLPYNTFVLMIVVEIMKAGTSAIMQWYSGNSIMKTPSLMFAIPGLAYMITDNLSFILLTFLDPATLNVLWNSKVIWTATLMYFALGVTLTRVQITALVMLTLSLVVCEIPHLAEVGAATEHPEEASPFAMGFILTLMGTLVVSGGNVTCEWLMKKDKDETLFWQNFQLYIFGMVFNVVGLGIHHISGRSDLPSVREGLFVGWGWYTVVIVIVQSFSGICIGAVLKYVDNVAVIYCHTISMFLVTILGRLIFGFEVTTWFMVGLVICAMSLKLYYSKADLSVSEGDKQRYAPVPGLVDLEDDELAGLGFDGEDEFDIDLEDLDDVIAGLGGPDDDLDL